MGGTPVEPHGGYLCRLEEFDAGDLVQLAREALPADGEGFDDCSLCISVLPNRKVARLAYDAPFTYGRRGARWYETHHTLPKVLSKLYNVTVHAYVFDPDELEQVTTYGGGQKVGGERMRYADALTQDDDDDLDEVSFERMKSKWPLGHLAKVYGVAREEIIRLPRTTSLLLSLDGTEPNLTLDALLQQGLPVRP
ncbi:MAG: hypothetical protein ACT4TC_19200 [Myxococcaceae bacterium]